MSYNLPAQDTSSFILGQNNIGTVATDDLNTIISRVNAQGGGNIYLEAGTYVISSALTGLSNVNLIGISPSATTIYANGTARNLSYAGTNVYNTGTITVASGVNITGSGTSWSGNVTAGQYLFLGTRMYKIASVTDNTHLVLSEGYGDNVTLPSSYRISTPIIDVSLSNLSVVASTGTGISFDDALQIRISNVQVISCNKGFTFTNVSRLQLDGTLVAASTSNGYEFTNVGLCDWESVNSTSNGGAGFLISNIKTVSGLMSATANTGDGFNCTTLVNTFLTIEASGNGGQGMEIVATSDSNDISGIANGNTSDGIKLTATADNNILNRLQVQGNGGYGINIAAATCDNNILMGVNAAGNSSGSLNDAGTGTLKSTTVNNLP